MPQYRFIFTPSLERDCRSFEGEPVSHQEMAEGQLSIIATYTLHLHEDNLMEDYSNYGWIEKRGCSESEWEEIDEDEL